MVVWSSVYVYLHQKWSAKQERRTKKVVYIDPDAQDLAIGVQDLLVETLTPEEAAREDENNHAAYPIPPGPVTTTSSSRP